MLLLTRIWGNWFGNCQSLRACAQSLENLVNVVRAYERFNTLRGGILAVH